MMEEWRAIAGYDGMYEVSSLGRVRSLDRIGCHAKGSGARRLSGRVLRPGLSVGRYRSVALSEADGMKRTSHHVHRLVAVAFLGDPPPDRPHVNHVDNDGSNNRVENLEWVSRSGNQLHALRTGRRGKVSIAQVSEIRRRVASGERRAVIAAEFRVDPTSIDNIASGRTWAHV